MDYKTAMISAARYLELRHDIFLDVSDIKSIMFLSNYAKTLNDEMVTFYWKEFKKSYRESKPLPKVQESKCGEVDTRSYFIEQSLSENTTNENLGAVGSIEGNRLDESKNWLNLQDESDAKLAIRLPSLAI